MRHLTQPALSRLCGQTCLAMILDVSITEAAKLVRKGGGTRTKDLREVLEAHGYECPPRMQRGYPTEDGMYLLTVHFHGRSNKHWVILLRYGDREMYYDPEFPCIWYELPEGYVTSYMRVSDLWERWQAAFVTEHGAMMRKKKRRETGNGQAS